jgi:hypothetical protein
VNDDGSPLEALRSEAQYRRARLALYRARIYSQRATSASKLRELERAAEGAEDRLRRAERENRDAAAGGRDPDVRVGEMHGTRIKG